METMLGCNCGSTSKEKIRFDGITERGLLHLAFSLVSVVASRRRGWACSLWADNS